MNKVQPYLVAVAVVACLMWLTYLVNTRGDVQQAPQATQQAPSPAPQYGPNSSPPAAAPTIDFAELNGLDPQTKRSNDHEVRVAALEWKVAKLEAEVRTLFGERYGPRGSRIGEAGPVEETTDTERD